MILNPIIPVWLMIIICVILLIMKRQGIFHYIRQILVVLLLFAINLRIMVPNGEVTTMKNNVNVLFVIDNTLSMLAEDYNGNGRRIDAMKADCGYIMEQLPGSSFSVVSFGNDVKTLLPYTIDTTNVQQAINSLQGHTYYHAQGTSLNDVLQELSKTLKEDDEFFQVVFFISDGEITQKEKLRSIPELKNLVDSGAVLGYGTEEGGRMRVYSYFDEESEPEELYYYDDLYTRQTALSKIDEKNLKSIASDMGIDYVHMTSQSEIDRTLSHIQSQIRQAAPSVTSDSTDGYADTYFYLLPPLLLLLAIDFVYYKRKVKL
ncbi:MAG: VWA domain-containing protein [Lachnospiraceae bacterium]|nr:VWA domain-containing protein [Lachnospiraceae bacterium]